MIARLAAGLAVAALLTGPVLAQGVAGEDFESGLGERWRGDPGRGDIRVLQLRCLVWTDLDLRRRVDQTHFSYARIILRKKCLLRGCPDGRYVKVRVPGYETR